MITNGPLLVTSRLVESNYSLPESCSTNLCEPATRMCRDPPRMAARWTARLSTAQPGMALKGREQPGGSW